MAASDSSSGAGASFSAGEKAGDMPKPRWRGLIGTRGGAVLSAAQDRGCSPAGWGGGARPQGCRPTRAAPLAEAGIVCAGGRRGEDRAGISRDLAGGYWRFFECAEISKLIGVGVGCLFF